MSIPCWTPSLVLARLARGVGLLPCACLISLVVGCGSTPPQRMSAAETREAQPIASLTSAQLQEKYRLTPHGTNEGLGGEVIEVTGPVTIVGTVPDLGDIVMLSGGTRGSRPILCQVAEGRPWDKIAPGLMVTIKGQLWRTKPGSVPLVLQCHIAEIPQDLQESLHLTAPQLSASFTRNRESAHELLANRWVWVAGEVASIDRINGWMYLRGSESGLVRCSLGGRDFVPEWGDDLERGQVLEVLGQVIDGDRRQVILQGCLPPRHYEATNPSAITQTGNRSAADVAGR